jgi:SAM-dependent methyltransferase
MLTEETATQFATWEEAVQWLINQPDQQEVVKACYYDSPLQGAADRYWQSGEWTEIRQYMPRIAGRALDIGAGNGIASYALAKDGWQVEALEPDPSNLVGVGAIRSLATRANLPINVVQEFGERLPFPDQHFEFVFARQVLHHAQDLPQLCREIQRVLRPGGVFVAVRDHVISTQADLPKFLAVHPLHKFYGGENAFLPKEYIGAMEQAGLTVDRVLKSFDSVINYAPLTPETLRQSLKQRLIRLPAGELLGNILLGTKTFPIALKLLSKTDNRPGRPHSFVCHKSRS